MKTILILAVIAAIGYLVFLQLSPHDEKWLHGEWRFAGEQADYMTFYSDGTVELSNDERIYARCVYASVVSNEVSVECKVKGKVHELGFIGSNNGSTLTNRKHADSVYHKIDA